MLQALKLTRCFRIYYFCMDICLYVVKVYVYVLYVLF
jgi:hypothetical protein